MPHRRHALAALRGSIPPLITPFKNGEVDYDRYAELVEFQIKEGSHGILVNGTTAEPSTLTTEERNRLVTLSVEATAGRVPVVAATGSQSLAESRVLTPGWDLKAGSRPMGTPVGMAVAADGALWVAEDKNATVLRIAVDRP